jgi:hypothetical protein
MATARNWRLEAAFLPRFERALEADRSGLGAAVDHGQAALREVALSDEQRRLLLSRLRLATLVISPNVAVADETSKIPGSALLATVAEEPPAAAPETQGVCEQPQELTNGALEAPLHGVDGVVPPKSCLLVGRHLGITVNPEPSAKTHRSERDVVRSAGGGGKAPRLLAFVHGLVPAATARAQAAQKRASAAERLRGVERGVVTITDASDDRVVLREVPVQLCILSWTLPHMPGSS